MGPLEKAMRAMEERKDAAGAFEDAPSPESVTRAAFSGLDIDFDEAISLKPLVGAAMAPPLLAGVNPMEIVFGFWLDGFATGILLEKQRSE
jgi:hypothetical protein